MKLWLGIAVASLLAAAGAAQQAATLRPADCALLVVSTGLSRFGAEDLHLLYEFAQKAGAELPKTMLKDRYAEIAQLGDADATAQGIAAALGRLGAKYRAVDLILHTHGRPFEMVCADGPVDVVEFAIAANGALAARARAAQAREGVDVALRVDRGRCLAALGGGGGGLGVCANQRLGAARLRLIGSGDGLQVATRTGHYLRLQDGGVRADAEADAAATFVVYGGAIADRARLRLGTSDGRGLRLDADDRWQLAAGEGQELEVRLLPDAAALAVQPLPAAALLHLRCALTTACHGATHAAAWCMMGFHAAAGSRGVSADSATSFPTFLHYWSRGYSFAEAVQFANGSDVLRIQDRLAGKRFDGVDSCRVVAGDGDLDCASALR